MKKAIFLDRDGVLIRSALRDGKPIAINDVSAMEILPGVEQACRELKAAGFLLVMVTNQPDVGRGLVEATVIETMNNRLSAKLGLDAAYACYHDDVEKCDCRKPAPGMLLGAAKELDIDLPGSIMVGDRWRDIEAGQRAGCRTVYVTWGQGEALTLEPDLTVPSLLDGDALDYRWRDTVTSPAVVALRSVAELIRMTL